MALHWLNIAQFLRSQIIYDQCKREQGAFPKESFDWKHRGPGWKTSLIREPTANNCCGRQNVFWRQQDCITTAKIQQISLYISIQRKGESIDIFSNQCDGLNGENLLVGKPPVSCLISHSTSKLDLYSYSSSRHSSNNPFIHLQTFLIT